jgi:hypothetical protein
LVFGKIPSWCYHLEHHLIVNSMVQKSQLLLV